MGFLGLAPSILLPPWRDYERLVQAEQLENHLRGRMEQTLEKQRRFLEAAGVDPGVARRMAWRDLNLKPDDALEIQVLPVSFAPEPPVACTPIPAPPPAFLRPILARLPDWDYDAVFCDPALRRVIILLSMTVICVALILYARPRFSARSRR